MSLAFAPDGKSLALGWENPPTAFVWDLVPNKVSHLLPWHESGVGAVAYSPDGKLLATGCGPEWPPEESGQSDLGKIRLWDLASGKLIREIKAHRNRVNSLAFSPNNKRLLSGGGDDTAKVWDVGSGKEVRRFMLDSRSDQVIASAFSADGKKIVIGGEKGEIVTGDVETGKSSSGLMQGGTVPRVLAFPAGTDLLLQVGMGRGEYVVRSSSLSTAKHDTRRYRPDAVAMDKLCAITTDGKVLAHGGRDRRVYLGSLETGKQLLSLDNLSGQVTALAFSPDGKTLAVGLSDSTVQLWDLPPALLNALWRKLSIVGEPEGEENIKVLVGMSKEVVPYLATRLKHMAGAEKQVRQIIRALDDDDFEKREKASRQLQALGREAAFALERALEDKPSAEVQKRIEAVLASWASPAPAPAPVDPRRLNAEQLALWKQGKWPPKPPVPSEGRALKRAFTALEKMGTPEARGLLKDLAETAPDGVVRDQAKASLDRLPKSKSPGP